MQKKDIVARKLIGYRASSYHSMRPAVVLDTALWHEVRRPSKQHEYRLADASQHSRYAHSSSWNGGYTIGHLVIIGSRHHDAERRDAVLTRLQTLIAEMPAVIDAAYVMKLSRQMPDELHLDVVNTRHLHGPSWEALMTAEQAQRDAEQSAREAEQAAAAVNARMLGCIKTHAEEADLQEWLIRNEGEGRVSLPTAMLAKLLGIETEEAS